MNTGEMKVTRPLGSVCEEGKCNCAERLSWSTEGRAQQGASPVHVL